MATERVKELYAAITSSRHSIESFFEVTENAESLQALALDELSFLADKSEDEHSKQNLVSVWLDKADNEAQIHAMKPADLLSSFNDTNLEVKQELIYNYITSSVMPITELKELLIELTENAQKKAFSITCLDSQNISTIQSLKYGELCDFLDGLKSTTQESYLSIWLKNQKNVKYIRALAMGELKELTSRIDVTVQNLIIYQWLKNQKNVKSLQALKIEDLKNFVSGMDDAVRASIIKQYANSYDNFLKLATEDRVGGSRYNTKDIAFFYGDNKMPKDGILQLCRDLYPDNEFLKTELMLCFIKNNYITKDIISAFVTKLQSDDEALAVIDAAQKRGFFKTEIEILNLAANRLSSRYESLSELLATKEPLDELLTAEGLTTVSNLFGDLKNISIKALLSYYDIKNTLSDFKKMVRPEVLQQFTTNFVPSNRKPYLLEAEAKKIENLTGIILPKMAAIAVPIKQDIDPINPLTANDIAKHEINFKDSIVVAALGDSERSKLCESFRELLSSNNLQEEGVANFFETFLQMSEKLQPENAKNLFDVFCANKKEFAYYLSKEGAVDKLHGIVAGMTGCVANIATRIMSEVNGLLIKDDASLLLYPAFSKMAFDIFNSGGDNLDSSANGADMFSATNIIGRSSISTIGFLDSLRKHLNNDQASVGKFLEKKLGDTAYDHLLDIVGKDTKTAKDSNLLMAELACHLVIKDKLPELHNDRYLQPFNDKCEAVFDKVGIGVLSDTISELSGIASQIESKERGDNAH